MYNSRPGLLIGFHGCEESVRDSLLTNPNVIKKSGKPYDWLGHGMYFWENNAERAYQWAMDKKHRGEIDMPSIIGAVLDLGYCFDLTDSKFTSMIKAYYELFAKECKNTGNDLPKNRDTRFDIYKDKVLRELDCKVIEFMHDQLNYQIAEDIRRDGFSDYKIFDSARGVFTEGGPAYKGAGIVEKTHTQICIRNINCIKGFFLPRKEINFLRSSISIGLRA